jgi:hypothetical protein
MNSTNDTNMTVSGSGTASDPYVYNFHTIPGHVVPFNLHDLFMAFFGLGVIVFLGFHVLKNRKSK